MLARYPLDRSLKGNGMHGWWWVARARARARVCVCVCGGVYSVLYGSFCLLIHPRAFLFMLRMRVRSFVHVRFRLNIHAPHIV